MDKRPSRPILQLLVTGKSKEVRTHKRKFSQVSWADALTLLAFSMRTAVEWLKRARDKYQGMGPQEMARIVRHFERADGAQKRFFSALVEGSLDPKRTEELIRTLHISLVGILDHQPYGSWFRNESQHLEKAVGSIEEAMRKSLGVDLSYVRAIHRRRTTPEVPPSRRHLTVVR
jgi:hypothetical protein